MFITMTFHCNEDNKTNYELQNVQPLQKAMHYCQKRDALHNHCEKSRHKNHCPILLLQNKL